MVRARARTRAWSRRLERRDLVGLATVSAVLVSMSERVWVG